MSSNVIFNKLYEKKILKIEFNNSSKKNALNLEMIDEIASKLSQSSFITDFKCIVITGCVVPCIVTNCNIITTGY